MFSSPLHHSHLSLSSLHSSLFLSPLLPFPLFNRDNCCIFQMTLPSLPTHHLPDDVEDIVCESCKRVCSICGSGCQTERGKRERMKEWKNERNEGEMRSQQTRGKEEKNFLTSTHTLFLSRLYSSSDFSWLERPWTNDSLFFSLHDRWTNSHSILSLSPLFHFLSPSSSTHHILWRWDKKCMRERIVWMCAASIEFL